MQTDLYSQPSASSSVQTGTQQKASAASSTAPGQIRVIKRKPGEPKPWFANATI
jgi:hypothetical protein